MQQNGGGKPIFERSGSDKRGVGTKIMVHGLEKKEIHDRNKMSKSKEGRRTGVRPLNSLLNLGAEGTRFGACAVRSPA